MTFQYHDCANVLVFFTPNQVESTCSHRQFLQHSAVSACSRKMQGHWCIQTPFHDALKCCYRRLLIPFQKHSVRSFSVADHLRRAGGSKIKRKFLGQRTQCSGRVQNKALQEREVSPTLQLWSHVSWFVLAGNSPSSKGRSVSNKDGDFAVLYTPHS